MSNPLRPLRATVPRLRISASSSWGKPCRKLLVEPGTITIYQRIEPLLPLRPRLFELFLEPFGRQLAPAVSQDALAIHRPGVNHVKFSALSGKCHDRRIEDMLIEPRF